MVQIHKVCNRNGQTNKCEQEQVVCSLSAYFSITKKLWIPHISITKSLDSTHFYYIMIEFHSFLLQNHCISMQLYYKIVGFSCNCITKSLNFTHTYTADAIIDFWERITRARDIFIKRTFWYIFRQRICWICSFWLFLSFLPVQIQFRQIF